jgi:branched-subunit amino acid permease
MNEIPTKPTPILIYVFWIVLTAVIGAIVIMIAVMVATAVPLIVLAFPLAITVIAMFLLFAYLRRHRR